MPMLLNLDVVNAPPVLLGQCRALQRFFEATDFPTLAPHDELKYSETKYVLADPGRIPVLDGLGPVGGGMHTREEFVDLRSLARRIVLLADLLAEDAGRA